MKRFLAIMLSLLMIFSLVACTSDGNENDEEKQSDEANDKLPETEDEILEYVLNALKATVKYEGDITLSATSSTATSQTNGSNTNEISNVETHRISFDSVNKLRYWEEISESSRSGNSSSLNKTFEIDGVLYGIEKVTDSKSAEAKETYFRIHDSAKAEHQISNHKEYFEKIVEMYSGIELAADVDEINSAFDTALSPLLKGIYSLDDDAPALVKEISAEVKDGVPTLTIGFDFSVLAELAGIKGGVKVVMNTSLAAKDNKLTDFAMSFEIAQSSSMGETLIQEAKQTASYSMSVEYAFAKDKYDALTVNLPENEEDIIVTGAPAYSYGDVNTTIYINGIDSDSVQLDSTIETPEQALKSIVAATGLSADKIKVKIYKDEAMTEELTADTATEDDILSLDKVYLDVTPVDCALVCPKFIEKNEYSKPFRIVAPFLSMLGLSTENRWTPPVTCQNAGEYMLDAKSVADEYCEIWVNGVKQDPKQSSITIENGKTYIIEYVTVVSENNVD